MPGRRNPIGVSIPRIFTDDEVRALAQKFGLVIVEEEGTHPPLGGFLGSIFLDAVLAATVQASAARRGELQRWYQKVETAAGNLLQLLGMPAEVEGYDRYKPNGWSASNSPAFKHLREAAGRWAPKDFHTPAYALPLLSHPAELSPRDAAQESSERFDLAVLTMAPFAVAHLARMAREVRAIVKASRDGKGPPRNVFADMMFDGLASIHKLFFGQAPAIRDSAGDYEGTAARWAHAVIRHANSRADGFTFIEDDPVADAAIRAALDELDGRSIDAKGRLFEKAWQRINPAKPGVTGALPAKSAKNRTT